MASGHAAPRRTPPFIDPPGYARHQPEETLLYRLVEQHYPTFLAAREAAGRPLPSHVRREFDAYLKCGRLEHGFLRVKCEACHAEKLVAFSCKGRAVCPSCGARRMAETAALLVDEVLPERPLRQWVLCRSRCAFCSRGIRTCSRGCSGSCIERSPGTFSRRRASRERAVRRVR
jgi:hypothetical protein